MKRHALLIGYSGGGGSGESFLSGVSLDLENYKDFLMSAKGGAWYGHEITTIQNTSKENLKRIIEKIKLEQNDITWVVFSGHGDYENKNHFCRDLLINSNETILEKELYGLSSKEILICDCCAQYRYKRIVVTNESKSMILETDYEKKIAREKYNKLVMECSNQKLRFYAAKAGYSAKDTDEGGLYTVKLLETLNKTDVDINIVNAHDNASRKVIIESSNEQIPEKRVDRVLKFLPGAIVVQGGTSHVY